MRPHPSEHILIILLLTLTCSNLAQTTAFSYQGRLSDAGSPANGTYLMQFTLFDSTGTQIGPTLSDVSISITAGVFNTTLDFGPGAFSGENRSLQVAVKKLPSDPYTVLAPNQQINSSPYAVKSLRAASADDAAKLGGVESDRFVQSDGNGNVSLGGNLTVSGTTSFDTVNAATQFNLGGQRALASDNFGNLFVGTNSGNVPDPKDNGSGFAKSLLSSGLYNTFLGNFAGWFNTTGSRNTFVGNSAGYYSTTGNSNAFYGVAAGISNSTGSDNAFFGDSSGGGNTTGEKNVYIGAQAGSNGTTGNRNTITGFNSGGGCSVFPCGFKLTGSDNAFYGYQSGLRVSTGTQNSFFGSNSGINNSTGNGNSFIGESSGLTNTAGSFNSFVGESSGRSNTTGNQNAFFGNSSGRGNTTGFFNSFFGTNAGFTNIAGSSNSFFGRNAGLNSNADNNAFFGTSAGQTTTTGASNSFFGSGSGFANSTGNLNTFIGWSTGNANVIGIENTIVGANANVGLPNLTNATAIGSNALVSTSNSIVLGSINSVNGGTATVNVGIGTSAPQARFHVVGSSWFQGDTTPLPAAAGKGIVIGFSGEQGYISGFDYGTFTPKNLLLNLSGANVGIGTSTANSKLTVAGLIETTLGGIKFPDGTIQTTAGGGSGVTSLNGLTNNVTLAAGSNITITPAGNTLTIASTAGSGGILNQTTPQTGANFNIDGSGTANSLIGNTVAANDFRSGSDTSILNAIGGVLRVGLDSGIDAAGGQNTYVGNNSGDNAGSSDNNTFVGYQSGRLANGKTGSNSFFGAFAGSGTKGGFNSFFGSNAGAANANGSNNTFVGSGAQALIGNDLSNATAIGSNAAVLQNNSLVLGSINGVNGAIADTSVGIGTAAPKAKLEITGGNILVGSPGQGIILKSPNGAVCRLFSIDNAGAMVLANIACP